MRTLFLLSITLLWSVGSYACTNFIVTPGASANGSTLLVYTNDGEWLYTPEITPAMDHLPGDSLTFVARSGAEGKIHQVPHTYKVIGFQMNEHQVAVGETTFMGREELWNHSKYLEYWHLMKLALLRARTAREAITVMTSLAEQYGYGAEGESFSIIDKHEAWILEMVGTGDGGEGAIWVAVRIPDGMISAHANMARIGEFPLDDPENCLYSDNVISFAIEKGYYDPQSGEPFRFNEAYNPVGADELKYCATRVWHLFSESAPSQHFSPEYHRGKPGAKRYPLCIKPDHKLTLREVMQMVRDHYEETPWDMTKGIAAGDFGSPNRCPPLVLKTDSATYSWERPISTYNSAFSILAEANAELPDDMGTLWFGEDDTYFTCYVPFFMGVTKLPKPYVTGDINRYDRRSAWWAFNFVANFANIKYERMKQDIQKVQNELEQSIVDKVVILRNIYKDIPTTHRTELLTSLSSQIGEKVHKSYVELGDFLVMKYNDGYEKDENYRIKAPGYPQEYLDYILRNEGDKMRIRD
ncbi:MAG: hypothetical protein CSA95_09270 [Bacteroidetes bacterium]|nr:MAG: hypothetical protein CSA95_09270 [Bacteroidota bacterium]PIE88592.1 MAG: hypothetical protein CSA04_01105 [Bacteroidota bacterium]